MNYDVVIIGAGIIGASSALWVQQDRKRVLLLDGRSPGSATSYGNACTIATYGCVPINSPSIYKRLPSLLFSKDSPLRIDWWYAISHLPWQLAFLRNCSASRMNEISAKLAALLELTDAGMDPLVQRSSAQKCFAEQRGIYYVFSSAKGYDAARKETELRRRYGTSVVEFSSFEFREMEPNIRIPIHRALLFEGARFLRDPRKLVEQYVDQFTKDGGTFKQSCVSRVSPDPESVSVHLEDGTPISCRKLIVAGGAWSKGVVGSGAEDLPLDTERGYHILFKSYGDLVERPVAWVEGGFYTTPMDQGLRLAGTVELAGLKEKHNKDRIGYLTRSAHKLFGDIGQPDDTWLGFRSTFPDALPVIGVSHKSNNILFAFGHQHVGLTLGGATGKIIADLVEGREPPIDLRPYSPARFL
ncbi:MAG: FAD-binding oxidoreductase [Arenicellales bacterium]|nr:FAD-binding oxidoreductase [Arenicellales bacterium]